MQRLILAAMLAAAVGCGDKDDGEDTGGKGGNGSSTRDGGGGGSRDDSGSRDAGGGGTGEDDGEDTGGNTGGEDDVDPNDPPGNGGGMMSGEEPDAGAGGPTTLPDGAVPSTPDGGPIQGSGSCCSTHDTPGCNNADLQVCVCEKDPTCCTDAWGPQCTFIVEQKYCQAGVRECVCGTEEGQWSQTQCCEKDWSSTCDSVAKGKCGAIPGCF